MADIFLSRVVASQYSTVTGSSQKFTSAMTAFKQYVFRANTDSWVKVDVTGGSASAAANSHYVPAGQPLHLFCEDATSGFVHVVRDSADGKASLSELDERFHP